MKNIKITEILKNKNFILSVILFIFPLKIVFSQTQPKTEIQDNKILIEGNPLLLVESSDYLERHIVSKKISRVKEEVEYNLRKLAKIIKTYEKEVTDSQKNYDEAASLYKSGLEYYYSGDVLNGYSQFIKSRNITNKLLNDYANLYKKQSINISTEIAVKLSKLEEDTIKAPFFEIYESEHRLNVMKNKINSADDLVKFQRYGQAIDLYRNAKIIGVITLYKLEQDNAKKEQILEKYKLDLNDANYNVENIKLESF